MTYVFTMDRVIVIVEKEHVNIKRRVLVLHCWANFIIQIFHFKILKLFKISKF